MHVRDERVHRIGAELYPLICACDAYVGEMELAGPSVNLRHDVSISGAFRPKVYRKMRAQLLKSFGLDIRLFDRLHPVVVMSLLAQRVLSDDHQVSLDEHLWHYAETRGIPVSGLESVDEQLSVLAAIDPLPVCVQLRRLSQRPATLRRQTTRTLRKYLGGDVHGLYRMTRASLHQLRRPVLYDRNRRMVRRLIGLDPTRSFFIAVGAAHLGGQKGLIAGLKGYGWDVRPVRLQD